jgi:radical SAM protein with 4Fe4S-binding SPASM domain
MEHPNTFVGVSIKAGNPKQLYATAKVRRFNTVTRGISRAMDYFQSGVGIVYNSYFADNLIDMAEYAISTCRAKTIKVDFCTPVFIDTKPSALCVVQPNQLVANIIRDYPRLEEITSGQLSFIMSIPFCFWPREFIQELKAKDRIESVCHLIKREGIVVGNDGSLYMCNELFDFPIGKYAEDFHDPDSLIEFLNKQEINEYYAEMSRYPSDRCQECSWYMDCGGGCPLQWSIYDPEQLVHPI